MEKIKEIKEILNNRFMAIKNAGQALKDKPRIAVNKTSSAFKGSINKLIVALKSRVKKQGALDNKKSKGKAIKPSAVKKPVAKKVIAVSKPLKKQGKTKEADKPKPAASKKKVLWIVIPVALFVLLAGAAAGYYFYFYYYLKPNFSEQQHQEIVSDRPGKVEPGDKITYTINLKNTGNTTVTNMEISTVIPGHCSLVSSAPEAVLDSQTGTIIFNIESIPKNTDQKVSYTILVDSPLDNGTLLKTSGVLFKYDVRDETGLGFEVADILENTVVSSPVLDDFSLSMTDLNKGDLNIEDVIRVDLSVKNTGNMHAKGIDVITVLPEKFELIESSAGFPAVFDSKKNTIIWNIKELLVGSSKSMSFRAKIGQQFEHLETFEGKSILVYDGATIKENVFEGQVVGYPNFSESSYTVADINGGSTWAGDVLRYTITLRNTGLRPGKDFKLICPIPANTSFLTDSVKPGGGFTYDSGQKTAVWTIENLETGQEKIFEFSVAISEALTGGGAIKSQFTVEGDEQYVELGEKTVSVRRFINHTIVCMGDSLIAYSNWPAILDSMLESTYPRAEYNTVGVGVPAMMSHQGYHKFDATVAPHGPQIIVFGFGSNDVGTSVNSFINGMTGLINKGKGMGATVIVHSIGYINTDIWVAKRDYREYNEALRALCAQQGVPFVDVYTPMAGDPGRYLSDGLHFTAEGANLVAGLVFNTMRNYLDADGERR
jgi:uncharacterized repeat protein (TIGR01451 family)